LKLSYDKTIFTFAFIFHMRHYIKAMREKTLVDNIDIDDNGLVTLTAGAYTRPLVQLNVSTFCGIR